MRILYIDASAGIAGDMMLGALVDMGLPFELLEESLTKLGVDGYTLEQKMVQKNSISATKIDVHVSEGHVHRHLSDIVKIIEQAGFDLRIEQIAKLAFQKIAVAEAKIHNSTPEKIHFHEVGAVDAIVDIVGTAIGIDYFGPDIIAASEVPLGKGTIKAAHGVLPLPAPATLEILKDYPVRHIDADGERVTPTGAALLKTLIELYGASELPSYVIKNAGYGAGTKDYTDRPNLLRLILGEGDLPENSNEDEIDILETNIDDMNPQIFGHLIDLLYTEGALEVFITPVFMKKNRPGQLLTVLCKKDLAGKLSNIIFSETTTTGIRYRTERRRILPRRIVTVETDFGPVKVKYIGTGNNIKFMPEYDDCSRVAKEHDVPIARVMQSAIDQAKIKKD